MHIGSDIPDQHSVTFNLTATDGEETWNSTFIMNFNAPVIQINSISIDDTDTGNGDGELDPGESASLTINYSNTGHAVAYDVDVYLEGRSGFTEIAEPMQHFNSIGFFGSFDSSSAACKAAAIAASPSTAGICDLLYQSTIIAREISIECMFRRLKH